jgi:membrane associated rhomboid family serine protease
VTETKYCYRHPDRETGLSCSDCGRPICVDCMTVAPVGIRCPEHAGKRSGPPRPVRSVQRTAARRGFVITAGDAIVTKILVAVNVLVYLAELAGGSGVNGNSGWIYEHGALVSSGVYANGHLAGVAHDEWWRLITAAFLHYGPIHLGLNMLALWWLGSPVELALGRLRYLCLYLAAGLAGSAGALIATPNSITVGASGAIFGLLGAGLILEYRATGRLAGNYLTLIIINIAFTLAVPGISIGGHVGGLIAGIVGLLVLTGLNNVRLDFRTRELAGAVGLVAIGAISVAIAYLKVHGMA